MSAEKSDIHIIVTREFREALDEARGDIPLVKYIRRAIAERMEREQQPRARLFRGTTRHSDAIAERMDREQQPRGGR